jgi:glycosyltransferase involved in cell wall biosynthesis
MDICLDYQPAVAQRAGIGRYTRQLARCLAQLRGAGDRLRLFYLDFARRAAPPDIPGAAALPWRRLPGALVQQLWKRAGRPSFDRLAGPADLYHFPNFIIPPLRRGRAVVSIHDMSFLRLPECAEARNRAYLEARLDDTIARADAILTISRFSAREIVALRPAAAGKVHVVPPGIEDGFARPPAERVAAVRRRLGLPRPYLLSVGTLEPRKNYPLLARAFDVLDRDDLDLVVAGMPGWRCEPILASFRAARRAAQIRYLRYVADEDLPALYAGAEIFALPSLYEGFGFPPLEAMACGTPVVSSAGGALPEVLGDAAEIVGEFEVESWRAALARLLGDDGRRRELAARGAARARRYRWEETARRTWEVYRHVAAGGDRPCAS